MTVSRSYPPSAALVDQQQSISALGLPPDLSERVASVSTPGPKSLVPDNFSDDTTICSTSPGYRSSELFASPNLANMIVDGPPPSAHAASSPSPTPTSTSTSAAGDDRTTRTFVNASSAPRVNTDVVIATALHAQYPKLSLTVTPASLCDLLSYASSGNATLTPLIDPSQPLSSSLTWRRWLPPPRRSQPSGTMASQVHFGKYSLKWTQEPGSAELDVLLYVVDGRDGLASFPQVVNYYILSSPSEKTRVDALIAACGSWMLQLRNELLVFDGGFWQKSRELFESVRHASWSDVILDEDKKASIIADVSGFFDAQETYQRLKVPWKRGIIYYGPPGNGKTISIKAMMRVLYERKEQFVPSLYVKTLASFGGPEYSIKMIFAMARQQAPCYLIFEDLDSIVDDRVRSYFLNEVDGLKKNDGILMVGSTNHLDRLDPGIAKRPSRFDRKYFFPNPSVKEREMYAEYWRGKLEENEDVEFPEEICPAIAGITGGFSFAYIQEAFVASLLAIARRSGGRERREESEEEEAGKEEAGEEEAVIVKMFKPENDHPELDKYPLWVEMKKQVKTLREGLGGGSPGRASAQRKHEAYPPNIVHIQPKAWKDASRDDPYEFYSKRHR